MTPGAQKVIDAARAEGLEVEEAGSGVVDLIVQRHRGTGKVLHGLRIYPNGTAIDLTVDLTVSKGIRSPKIMRKFLGIARKINLDQQSTKVYHPGMNTAQALPRPVAQLAVEAALLTTRVTWPAWHDVTGSTDEVRAKLSAQEIKRHKTAISRRDFSVPVKALMKKGLLDKETSLFDYGCGRGDDIRLLKQKGYEVGGWDPYYAPENKKSQADLVNLGFVLNVIEDPEERSEVLQKAWKLAKGALIVSTRPPMKHTFKAYSDGFVTSAGTFQKFWKAAELKSWLEAELGVQPESSGSPCCYIMYKNDEAKEQLAA